METRSPEELRAAALVERAEFWESSCDPARAEAAWKQAIALHSGPALRQRYAQFLARHSRFAEAVTEFQSLLNEAESSENAPLAAVICQNLAALLREWGQHDLAAQYAELATRWSEPTSACDLISTGNEALMREEFAEARRCFLRALALADQHNDIGTLADARASFGVLHLLEDHLDKARTQFVLAFELHQLAGDREGMFRDTLNLGELCYRCGEWERGQRIIRPLIAELQRYGIPHLQDRAERLLRELSAHC